MRVTTTEMARLIEFLNHDFGENGEKYGSPETARRVQSKWRRRLHFVVEPKDEADGLADSLRVGIAYNENLIISHRAQLKDTNDEHRRVLHDEIRGYRRNIARMRRCLALSPEQLVAKEKRVRSTLKGARQYQPAAEALKELVDELNKWSLGKNINPTWKLELQKTRQLPSNRPVLSFGGHRFVVNGRLTSRNLQDSILGDLARLLETGELDRLRRCQLDSCRCYFYAHDFRSAYCGRKHQVAAANVNAEERMRRHRAHQKQESRKKGVQRLTRLVSGKPVGIGNFGGDRLELESCLERIRDGNTVEATYDSLSPRLRRRLDAAA